MFGNLSRSALTAVSIASDESARLGYYYLGVEHLVMGLCRLEDADARLAVPTPERILPSAPACVTAASSRRSGYGSSSLPFRLPWSHPGESR